MRIAVTALLLAALCFFCGPSTEAEAKTKQQLKIGFVYISPVGDAGWSYAHDAARRKLAQAPENKTFLLEGVPGGQDAEDVIRAMSGQGYDIIFTTSYDYMDATLTVAAEFPQTHYLHCSGLKTSQNVSTYFGRMYQARYLSGMVAGAMTKSNVIGFVAAAPISEVICGINAFTLGAREMNPNAKVHVLWSGSWYDPEVEGKAARRLIGLGTDVITQYQDSPAVQKVAAESGIYSVGYNTDMSRYAPAAHLVAAVWDWSGFYADVADKVRYGKWRSGSFWPGMESGIVDISPFGDMVPQHVRDRVLLRRQEIIDGNFVVFRGPVWDQHGQSRISSRRVPRDTELLEMNWFVEGVVGNPR